VPPGGDSPGKHGIFSGVTHLLYFARAAAELSGGPDIQLFPPGAQVVSPTPANGGEAKEMQLVIDEATATALEAARAAYQAQADAGTGDAPYLDFNHDDREAAAWPRRIYWAGADPQTGGVRAEVEWTSAGQEAIAGKTFRRFSPAFYAAEGKVTGAPVNMGGLVNRAAFTRIQPLFAKENQESRIQKQDKTMTPEEIAALKSENEALKLELAELTAKHSAAEETIHAHAKADAEALVAKAAAEGRIAPAAEVQARWVGAILTHPESKELLLAMAPNPVLAKVITGKPAENADSPTAILAKFQALPREEQAAYFAKHAETLKQAHDTTLSR